MPRKKKVNLPLIEVVIISLIAHVAGLFVLGGLTIWQAMKPEEPELEAPAIPPPPPEPPQHQVTLKDSQKSSARPKARIAVTNISQINLPDLDINMPVVESKVAVGTGGVVGGRGGFDGGGVDFSRSSVDFFGIKDNGENVAFILDTAKSMVEKQRGDVWGYDVVKTEIAGMINNLKPGTLFNIYAFDDNLEVFRPKPVAASEANRQAAGRWIERFWKWENNRFSYQGARGFDIVPDMTGLPIRREKLVRISGEKDSPDAKFELQPLSEDEQKRGEGSSRMDLAILAAAENGADAIFMITDGTPSLARAVDDKDLRAYQNAYEDYHRKKDKFKDSKEWKDYQAAMKEFHKKIADYQADRKRRGLPPEIREHGYPGGFQRPSAPKDVGWPPSFWHRMSNEMFVDMVGDRVKEIYREVHKSQLPPLHVVGYSTTDKEKDIMEKLQRPFRGGKFRKIEEKDLKEFAKDKEENQS
ncbi:hypothetical protein [Cerasicoccus fimbriatus]|uniref:hypothetical protein n=1 Tax=Cerasicoccus fimbriatus TaxID=3014554 RepID=UPI0022B590D0|nr:hypothetical protein [Cerasicoccus sp. TK19100]